KAGTRSSSRAAGMGRPGLPIPSGTSHRTSANGQASTRPINRACDWNLWFASLGPWQQSTWVVKTQLRLTEGSPSVLRLFRADPFGGNPPPLVRTVLWQYWFTDRTTKRATGAWWRRQLVGPFTGAVAVER